MEKKELCGLNAVEKLVDSLINSGYDSEDILWFLVCGCSMSMDLFFWENDDRLVSFKSSLEKIERYLHGKSKKIP